MDQLMLKTAFSVLEITLINKLSSSAVFSEVIFLIIDSDYYPSPAFKN